MSALREHQKRCWEDYQLDASSTWLYVRDQTTSAIVGTAEWKIFKSSPYCTGVEPVNANCRSLFCVYMLEGRSLTISAQLFAN